MRYFCMASLFASTNKGWSIYSGVFWGVFCLLLLFVSSTFHSRFTERLYNFPGSCFRCPRFLMKTSASGWKAERNISACECLFMNPSSINRCTRNAKLKMTHEQRMLFSFQLLSLELLTSSVSLKCIILPSVKGADTKVQFCQFLRVTPQPWPSMCNEATIHSPSPTCSNDTASSQEEQRKPTAVATSPGLKSGTCRRHLDSQMFLSSRNSMMTLVSSLRIKGILLSIERLGG